MFPKSISTWGNKPSIYVQKKVLTLAPDALVFLNGRTDVPICLKCNATEDLKNDITNISVSLGIEGVPGSASFTIVAPTKKFETKYIHNGKLIIGEMQEVKIFFKGRFPNKDGNYPYYTAFWGLITSVTESYNAGEYTIQVECADILKWWQIMTVNVHPSVITANFSGQQPSVLGSRFAYLNPFQTILALAEMGSENLMAPESFIKTVGKQDSIKIWRKENEKMIDYWRARFAQIGKSIKIFGYIDSINNQFPAKMAVEESYIKSTQSTKSLELQGYPKGIPKVNMDMRFKDDFLPFYEFRDLSVEESEYMSKLDMALQVKNYINYEFFMDVTGHIVFKPPFYNLDVRNNEPYSIIEDSDIISYDFTASESEVLTRLDVHGYINPKFKLGDKLIYGYYQDYNLAKQFGLRQQTLTVRHLKSKRSCTLYAINEMAKINSKRFSGSINIMGRPELRLGFPIYIPSKDCFYYVTSISHSFTFGSSFTTTLGLVGRRTKKIDYEVSNLKNGVVKNGAMVYVQENKDFQSKVNFKPSPQQEKLTELQAYKESQQHLGVYELKENDGATIVTLTKDESKIPVSDKDGYEVVGGFPYGRNLGIDATGKIIPGETKKNVGKYITTLTTEDQKKGQDEDKPNLESGKEAEAQIFVSNKGQILSEIAPQPSKSKCTCLEEIEKTKLNVLTEEEKNKAFERDKAELEREDKKAEDFNRLTEERSIAEDNDQTDAQKRLMQQRAKHIANMSKGEK